MVLLLIVGICSLATSLVLTRLFRDFFAFLEMVDRPDARRKLHLRPIPRVGGISIAITYFFVLAAVLISVPLWKEMLVKSGPSLHLLERLLPAVVIVFVTGLLDDFRGLTPRQKVIGQIVAACWAYWAGVRLAPFAGHPQLDLWLFPLSVLWLVFCANAFNLIDGLDGLASGVAALGAGGLLLAGVIHHQLVLSLAIVPLLGALLGFLYYNFNPATVFLGDCGSLLIGFLVGCFGLMWNQHAATGLGSLAPLMVVAVPTAEVAISIARRFLRRQPIFLADRNHIHHRLLSLGMTQWKAALVLFGVSALAVTLAVLQTIVHPRVTTMLVVLFAFGAYFGVRQLQYVEFRYAGMFLFTGEIRNMLRMRICLREYEDALSAARNLEEYWVAVCEVCAAAGFRYVAFRLEGQLFELGEDDGLIEPLPRMIIPVSADGQMTFVQNSRASESAMWIAPIVEALQEKLAIEERLKKPSVEDTPVDRLAAMVAVAR